MSVLKRVGDRGVTLAWCPHNGADTRTYLAAASKQGAGGGFDSYEGALEVYALDAASSEAAPLELKGAASTDKKFECLAWSRFTAQSTYAAGIIAGGMTDGSISVWDPAAIVAAGSSSHGDISVSPLANIVGKHRDTVTALAFNPTAGMNHILASGSADNTVLLFDLKAPGSGDVAHYAPAEGDVTGHAAPVTAVAWNQEVGHILATCARDGTTSVWDLRAKRPWCHLKDPSRSPCSALAWNPAGSGQVMLMTASDDDARPCMRLWDLRKDTTRPMFELAAAQGRDGHSRGIVDLAWCPHDEAIIASTGKDKRTLFWDLYTCAVVDELDTSELSGAGAGAGAVGGAGMGGAGIGIGGGGGGGGGGFGSQSAGGFGAGAGGFGTGAGAVFGAGAGAAGAGAGAGAQSGGSEGVRQALWNPNMPGVMACATLGREIQVHGITAFAGNPGRAPKWLQRPGSASFGFGGKLAICSKDAQNNVTVTAVQAEPGLVQSAAQFTNAMETGDFAGYCNYKVSCFCVVIDPDRLLPPPYLSSPAPQTFPRLPPLLLPPPDLSLPSRVRFK
jgi:protein transport protein SEC31